MRAGDRAGAIRQPIQALLILVLLCKVLLGAVLAPPLAASGDRLVEICTPEGPRFVALEAGAPLPADLSDRADCPWLTLGPCVVPSPDGLGPGPEAQPWTPPLPPALRLGATTGTDLPPNRGPPLQG